MAEDLVEFFSLSKNYNMPGWRVGFMVGNQELVGAQPFKSTGLWNIYACSGGGYRCVGRPPECVHDIRRMYQMRRDVLCDGMEASGWKVDRPLGTMFVWARIPTNLLSLAH